MGADVVAITGYTGTSWKLEIPAAIEDKPVTAIGANAFADHTELRLLILPAALISVGKNAFDGCDFWHILFAGAEEQWYAITLASGNDALEYGLVHCRADETAMLPGTQVSCTERPLLECSLCGDILLDENYEGSHSYEDKICTICGGHQDYAFTVSGDSVTITDYRGADTQVTVPATLQGKPVTAIGDGAFEDCAKVTKIVLPDTVTGIGSYAFAYCYELEQMQIPQAVTEIGAAAFTCCGKLAEAKVPSGVTRLEMDTFFNCGGLQSVQLPEGLTYIGDYAFGYCEKLTGLQLPDTVAEIDDYAFRGCISITTVTLPASLTAINEGAFSCCSKLQRIVIPDGVREIGVEAFFQCTRMGSITLPASITAVGTQAFDQCDNLRCVAYAGNQDQKNTIQVRSGNAELKKANWHLDGSYCAVVLDSATVHSSGKPQLRWDDLACMKGYEIYRATSSGGTYTLLASTSDIRFVDESAQFGVKYYYKLVGINNEDAASPKSAAKSVYCCCAQPQITTASPNRVPVISWSKVEKAAKYAVYRSDTPYGTFKKIATTSGLSYKDAGAPVGKVSYYKVKALGSSSNVNSNYSNIEGGCYIVAAPKCKVSLTSAGMPTISWGKVSGITFYSVYRSFSKEGPYELLANPTSLSFKDSKLPVDTTCYYKIVAVAPGDGCSNTTGPLAVTVTCAAPAITTSTESGTGKPVIKWKAVSGAAGYEISRAAKSTGTYTPVGTTEELTFTDTTAAGAKTYYYKVTAITPAGNRSKASSYKSAKCVCAAPEVSIKNGATSGKPNLTWNAVSGAKKYEVYRATSVSGKYTKLTTTTKLSYTNTSATVGKTYYYKVKAIAASAGYNSSYSQVKSLLAICAQPTLSITVNSTSGKPKLSWKSVTGAAGYEIYRAESADGEFIKLATQTGLSYTDTSAAADRDYWYRVRTLGKTQSLNSSQGVGKKVHTTLAKPVVTFRVDSATGKPCLTWSAVEGAVEFKVYRSSYATKSYKAVATTDQPQYLDTTAAVGKGYYYKVIAIGENSKSAYSAYKKLTVKCARPVLAAEPNETTGKPVLKWEKVTGAKKYEIYRATSETGKYTKLATTTKLTYSNTSAKAGKTYYYKVKAIASSSGCNSDYSQTVSVTVAPKTP